MSFRTPLSLTTLISASTIVVVVVTVAILTLLDVRRERSDHLNSLRSNGKVLADAFASQIADPLYFADVDRVEDYANLLASQQDVERVAVYDNTGRLLAESGTGDAPISTDFVLSALSQSQGVEQVNGNSALVAVPIAAGNRSLGVATITLAPAGLSNDIRSIILDHTWQGLLVAVVGAVFMFLAAKVTTKAVVRLAKDASELESGNLDQALTISGTSETVALGEALERMRVRLKAAQADLELLVAERTDELASTHDELKESIQARVTAEQERRNIETLALGQAGLATIGQLAASVAHEISQPLMYIRGSVELLVNGDGEPHISETEKQTLLVECLRQADRMAILANRLRTLVRSNPEIESLNIRRVLDNALILVRPRLRRNRIKLEIDFRSSDPVVRGNAGQLEQVFINLLQNAVDAIIEGERDSRQIQIVVDCSEEEDNVVMRITDNGPGIPAEIQGQVFEPFFTTKSVENGTGLGLAIVKAAIEEHRGRVYVESTSSDGTTFVVRIRKAGIG